MKRKFKRNEQSNREREGEREREGREERNDFLYFLNTIN